ncbi:MAG TPA: tyrosine-type recombinase/integrase [Blastocatellia bacterium]|nr:tyrosine-type recombinase/integrase [Blastocatellia bacterium]
MVRVFLGRDANGRKNYHAKIIRGPRKDAQTYLNGVLRELDLGTFVLPAATTLNTYLDHWLECAARPKVSRRTADGYADLLKRYIREPLGQKRLDRLKPLDIQQVYAGMQSKGLGALVIRHAHAVVNSALKQAVKWGLISRNPAEMVELPKVEHKERRVLSPAEAARFLEACAEMPRGLIFEFALLTGMRPEEYLAIQWSDLDVERRSVVVQRALVRHKGAWSFEQTKTAKSRRTIPIPEPLVKKLVEHSHVQSKERQIAGSLWQHYNLVFCSEVGTPLQIPHITYRYYRPILEKAELPRIRLYDLRHSQATILLMADEHPKVVSERLGHSTTRLTLDTYSHVLPTMQERATEKLEKLFYKQD